MGLACLQPVPSRHRDDGANAPRHVRADAAIVRAEPRRRVLCELTHGFGDVLDRHGTSARGTVQGHRHRVGHSDSLSSTPQSDLCRCGHESPVSPLSGAALRVWVRPAGSAWRCSRRARIACSESNGHPRFGWRTPTSDFRVPGTPGRGRRSAWQTDPSVAYGFVSRSVVGFGALQRFVRIVGVLKPRPNIDFSRECAGERGGNGKFQCAADVPATRRPARLPSAREGP